MIQYNGMINDESNHRPQLRIPVVVLISTPGESSVL